MNMAYLDNSATTKVCDEAISAAVEMMNINFGNPSSLHCLGVNAEKQLSLSKSIIGETLSCERSNIIFTSGGTESNNIAIFGAVKKKRREGNKIITTSIEHPSVLNCFKELEKDFQVVYIKPDKDGKIPVSEFQKEIDENTILVSCMLVNNETGEILPCKFIKDIIKAKSSPALFHIDAVQGYLKIPFNPTSYGADLVTISAHKIHGMKGCGALYIKDKNIISTTVFGGEQEQNIRSGTQNMPGIAAFSAAAKKGYESIRENFEYIKELRAYLINRLSEISDIKINSPSDGANHILNISVMNLQSEVMLHHLESMNVFVSAGSACSSKNKGKSHVLTSMGLDNERINSALRISLCADNDKEDIDMLIDGLKSCRKNLVGRKG
ncbi:MAG: cysteine desulfurase [Clostridia bacterium]|nr:cysteine desulfurase [Clostridia bacterium]